ncbi:hypothetical protein [Streptomyces sp. AC627_RSS907]|uniref:hypothetical protein n=1 Tax=Streptomyces sp. AC627_RSS907 TaxID=2823684 RepID=UPI0020B7CFB9|nr:hypothetical protein [Streptomyces sp. AC627_RSS907]
MSDADQARREVPTGPTGQEPPKHTHAGKGTVNHGPADQGPDTEAPDTEGSDTQGPATEGPDTPGSETEGPDTPGSGAEGPDAPGSETEGPDTPGSGSEGPDTPGSGSEGPGVQGRAVPGSATPASAAEGTVTRRRGAEGPATLAFAAEGPAAQALVAPASVTPAPPAQGLPGLDTDELALRRMLRDAVQDVEPKDGTLDHLRRAVPARRARKRQAAVGMAAAALFIGTAVPALMHVSDSVGPGADPSVAGHASQAQGGTSQGKDPAGGQSGIAGSAGASEGEDKATPEKKPQDEESGAVTGTAPGADPSASAVPDVTTCTAKQLGPAVVSSAAPDSTGVVYGSFSVTNVSSDGCTVVGAGSVVATPQGAADPTKIGTARHAAGDAAAGLPDPSLEVTSLTLAPGSAYEVRFAWVPSETCPTTGGSTGGTTGGDTGGPSPDPSPTGETPATDGTTDSGDAGTTTQLVTEDAPADGSVSVTYTPEGGSGSATATVSDACAGTVYWTGVLAGQE